MFRFFIRFNVSDAKDQLADWQQKYQIRNRTRTDTSLALSCGTRESEREIPDRWMLMGCRHLRKERLMQSVKCVRRCVWCNPRQLHYRDRLFGEKYRCKLKHASVLALVFPCTVRGRFDKDSVLYKGKQQSLCFQTLGWQWEWMHLEVNFILIDKSADG